MLNLLRNEFCNPHQVAFFRHGWATGHHDKHSHATKDGAVILGISSAESLFILPQVCCEFRVLRYKFKELRTNELAQ
jgi:hypothetical protein